MQDHTREELRTLLIRGDVNGVDKLLESGDIESPDQMIDLENDGDPRTLLMWACEAYKNHNDISLIRDLVKNHNANVDAQTTDGYTAKKAVPTGSANLEFRTRWGRTALHYACGEDKSNEDIVKCLLEYHADVNAGDEKGLTPLHYAASYGSCSITRLLFANDRVNLEAIEDEGATPLHWACYKGNADIVEMLLSNGANPNALEGDGWTPLIDAVESKSMSCVEAIIKAKVDLNQGDIRGQTALHFAVYGGNVHIVELLLKAKADWSAKDNDNRMPVEMVKPGHREPVVFLFVEALMGMVQEYEAFRDTILRGATQETCLLKTLEPDVVPHIAGYCDAPMGDALEKIRLKLDRLRPGHPRGQKRKHADV